MWFFYVEVHNNLQAILFFCFIMVSRPSSKNPSNPISVKCVVVSVLECVSQTHGLIK